MEPGWLLKATHAGPRPLRILVADYDRDSVLTLALLLREEGQVVRSIHSGEVMSAAPDSTTLGFDHYVLKPYDPQALVALIAQQRLHPAY